MRQRGAAPERIAPYDTASNTISNGMDPSLERKSAVYLKNAIKINRANTSLVKEYIVRNGIVGVSIWADPKYYNSTNKCYYCYDMSDTNHAVSIVGWDDDFPSSNFNSGSAIF